MFRDRSDQILILEKSRKADFFMRIHNADERTGMCGNGLRCLAKFIRDEKISSKSELSIQMLVGNSGRKNGRKIK